MRFINRDVRDVDFCELFKQVLAGEHFGICDNHAGRISGICEGGKIFFALFVRHDPTVRPLALAFYAIAAVTDFLDGHPSLRSHAQASVAYEVDMSLARARRGTYQYLEIHQCVKDVHGCPYVPGSSVKGMLRTALLAYLVQRDQATYVPLYDVREVLAGDRARACRRIEHEAFWRERPNDETVNDIMRYVSVSDSQPLSTDDLVFAKKYDKFSRSDPGTHKLAMGKISRDPAYREGNELNFYRECIRPGVRVELALDVDERIDAYLGGLVLDDKGLASVLEASFGLYQRCFLDRFDLEGVTGGGSGGADDGRCRYVYQAGPLAGGRCRNNAVGNTGYCNTHKDQVAQGGKSVACCLGGGVDFCSKTILNALLGEGRETVYEISRVLYAQFPTKLDRSLRRELEADVRDAGFEPVGMRAHCPGAMASAVFSPMRTSPVSSSIAGMACPAPKVSAATTA
mgnify:CR=1 FL=1